MFVCVAPPALRRMTPYSVPTCPHTAAQQQGLSPDGGLSAGNTTTALIHIQDQPCHEYDYDMVPPSISSVELPPPSPVHFVPERDSATPPPSYSEVVMSDLYRNPSQVSQ